MQRNELKDPDPEQVLACDLAMSLLEQLGSYCKAKEKAEELSATCLKMHRVYKEVVIILDIEENVDKPLTSGN